MQQTTSVDDIFRCIFFLGPLRINPSLERTTSQLVTSRMSRFWPAALAKQAGLSMVWSKTPRKDFLEMTPYYHSAIVLTFEKDYSSVGKKSY